MPGPGELPAQQLARVIGRKAGLARLRGLVDPVPRASQVLLVTGEAGMGKTMLLATAAGRARLAGTPDGGTRRWTWPPKPPTWLRQSTWNSSPRPLT